MGEGSRCSSARATDAPYTAASPHTMTAKPANSRIPTARKTDSTHCEGDGLRPGGESDAPDDESERR